VRFLCDALSSTRNGGADGDEAANVVLVSWMREYEFWKQEARKGGGLDLDKCRREGRLAFVDGLSGLFLDARHGDGGVGDAERRPDDGANAGTQAVRAPQTLPLRGAPPGRTVPARGPPAVAARQAARPGPATIAMGIPSSSSTTTGLFTLESADLSHLKSTILQAVAHIRPSAPTATRKTLLILDNPDILLATSPHPSKALTSLTSLFLTLHTQISHLLVHIQCDTPLLTLSMPPQPIEHVQHNLLVKMAHMSRRVLSVRVLDTGVARDVSGVLRVTEHRERLGDFGTAIREEDEDDRYSGKEVLYKVGGDGGVRVFERGGGGELG
jgi:elongator complex protein 6